MAKKTEVYTWRVSSATKADLEEAARETNRSVAELLDEIVTNHLGARDQASESDEQQQRRLHARVRRFAGCISGGGSRRSERIRELVRARPKRRHHRER